MAAILIVRLRSPLDSRELERRAQERKPRFLDVPGLVQKFYGREASTGDLCGVYLFETREALEAYRKSELARTIPTAYEASEVRPESYDVLFSLRPELGPIGAGGG